MSRRSRLSRDQRRKQKLAERPKPERVEPYHGNKYRSEKFMEALFQAEAGIHECDVMTDRRLTDRDVIKDLERMVLELRGQDAGPEKTQGFIARRIKSRWDELFSKRPRHGASDLAGILRTIIGSIECRSSMTGSPRGYLTYIEGFLGKLGVWVEKLPPDSLIQIEPFDGPLDDELQQDMTTASHALLCPQVPGS